MMLESEKELKITDAEEKIRNEDYANAIALLIEIIDADPKYAIAYNDLGVISWKQSKWTDAFGLFKAAVNANNSNPDFVSNLLDAALKLHKIEEVKVIFEKAAADNPENPVITDIYKAINNPENDVYRSIRAFNIGYWHPLIEKGDNFIQNGEYMEAARAYIEHADTVGLCSEVYNGLGIVQFNAQKYEEAFSLFLDSLKINPINTDTFLNMFDAAKECVLEEDALQIYETLAKEYPQLEEIRDETEDLKKK
jgi:tetratricopeptide (TPR) repeat protein